MPTTIMKAHFWLAAAIVMNSISRADDPQPVDETAVDEDDETLQAMRARVNLLRLEFADEEDAEPLPLVSQPILRYGDPTRIVDDGTLWIWTRGERPAAIMSLFRGRPPEGAPWNYEFTSLTDRPLNLTGRTAWTWEPQEQQRKWIELMHDVPGTPSARLTTLRALARQFEATETYEGQTYTLRLVPTPLYRYADEGSGVVDGALFSMANGTNPEVLLQIEARSDPDGPSRWFASIGRMSSAFLDVKFSGETEWTEEAIHYSKHDPEAPYYSVWGSDPIPQ